MTSTKPHENPLTPNKTLRQIYTAMVELRLLDEHRAARQRAAKARPRLASIRGEEACRVSTAIGLISGDLISDTQAGPVMDLLLERRPDLILRQIDTIASGEKERIRGSVSPATRRLPWIADASDRLKMAMGAALSFRPLKQTNIVVAYVHRAEVAKGAWSEVLTLAAKLSLPIIFVVLPDTKQKKGRTINLCAKARSAGVPGIPVDANDAVALYRVAQESIGRTRGGDGPVLIDCVAGLPEERSDTETNDPLFHMKSFLIGRKICSNAWANRAGEVLRRKTASSNPRM